MPRGRTVRQPGRSAQRRRSAWGAPWTLTGWSNCCMRTPSTHSGRTWQAAAWPARTAHSCALPASAPPSRTSATSAGLRRSAGGYGTPASPTTSPTCMAAASVRRCRRDTASGPPTSSPRGSTSSARRDVSAAVAASRGAPPLSTSPPRSGPFAPERADMRTIEQYLPDHPFFSGLDADALAILAGCATNVSFAPGQFLFRTGQPADQFFVVRRGRVALQVHGPAAGTMVVDSADAGDVVGWSWLVPPYTWLFDARAVEPTGAVAFDGACLRGKCEEDPRLGYELMKLVTQVMFNRLVAARVRLLDLYGSTGATSPLVSPLLTEARATWARPTDPGATDPGATDAGATHAAPG